LLDVLLPLLLLLLLLWWLLPVPFLADLFGAIALLVFLMLTLLLFFFTFPYNFSCVALNSSCTLQMCFCSRCRCITLWTNQIFNSQRFLLSNRNFFLSPPTYRLATELIAFRLCQQWTLIIAGFFFALYRRLFIALDVFFSPAQQKKHLKTCVPIIFVLLCCNHTPKALVVTLYAALVSLYMPRNKLAREKFNFKCHQSIDERVEQDINT
jgi:hypothetical protein